MSTPPTNNPTPEPTPEPKPEPRAEPKPAPKPAPKAEGSNPFWKIATLFSFVVNLVLVLVLLIAGLLIFEIKHGIGMPLLGGLNYSFVKMDEAHIKTTILVQDVIMVNDTITVNDTLPVVFDLPLSTNTTVTLTEATLIPNTIVYLNGQPVSTNIILPAGSPLKIKLDLLVPVNQNVPVVLKVPVNLRVPIALNVPVDIPLNQTELHEPFVNLARIIGPYSDLISNTPDNWADVLTWTRGQPYQPQPVEPVVPAP